MDWIEYVKQLEDIVRRLAKLPLGGVGLKPFEDLAVAAKTLLHELDGCLKCSVCGKPIEPSCDYATDSQITTLRADTALAALEMARDELTDKLAEGAPSWADDPK